ncbi:MAG: flippase-like domain-containing protein [Bryobacteraceae bacterium]|nr:flippase-like domain-containing protein [Solibacteraceae bacterium]MCL4841877.1 flippase-like domain-containing protein [Bryobacteraceae bacterium]MCO5353046.1 flippase-like domain-containing protein [Bryobacteraceae bacterium]
MATTPGPAAKDSSQWARFAVYALSFGCLLWVYHDFDWKGELPRLARIHWAWLAVAVASDILVYVTQAWRWNLLLRPIARLPLGRAVQAIYIGLFANEVLPLRSGELIRCYLQGVWNRISVAVVLSSALIERLIDGVWLILGFLLVSRVTPLPREVEAGVTVLTAVVGGLAALVLFAVFNRRFAIHVTTKHKWSEILRTLVEGLHAMGRSRSFVASVGASLVYLALQLVPIYAMLRGYELELGWGAAATVLVVLRLGTIVPGPPGNVGVFHFFCYLALHRMLGVDAQTAKSLAGLIFFTITVPLLVAGSIALAFTGRNIREILRHAREHHGQHGHADEAIKPSN